jgi:hypothetical protein
MLYKISLDNNRDTGGIDMGFEKFINTGARVGKPKISIWSRGQIGLNRGAIEKYRIKNFNFAVIYYDKENKKVGIKFTNDNNEEGTIKLVKRNSGGFSFSASSFLNSYGIDYEKTKQYPLTYDESNNLYVFKLE